MKFYRILSLLVLPLMFTANAHATVSDGTVIAADEIRPYAEWVEENMNIHMVSLPITTASGHRLKTALGLHGVQQARAAAAYLPGQIVINNMIWDADSPVAQSYLVHELVHHAQLLSRKQYPCHAAKEREAYMMQNQWLTEHGESPIVSQEWIDKVSSCDSSNYYEAD